MQELTGASRPSCGALYKYVEDSVPLTNPRSDSEARLQREAQTVFKTLPRCTPKKTQRYLPLVPSSLEQYKNPEYRERLKRVLKEFTVSTIPTLRNYSSGALGDVFSLGDTQCPQHSAVCVAGSYIHANYVGKGIGSRLFVAGEYPHEATLLWQFIFEQNCDIISLAKEIPGCKYTPDEVGLSCTFGNKIVKLLKKDQLTALECTFTYEIFDTITQTTQICRRLHYMGWKEASATDLPTLKNLVSQLETAFQRLTFVHCFAGVGRTGTLITAYFLKQKIIAKMITSENLAVELLNLIVALRIQRGENFVETDEQLFLLLDFGIDLLKNPLS